MTLKQNAKLKTAEDIDKYMRAKIPDPIFNPELHEIVIKNMIHTCGDWCKVDGKCSERFREETSINKDGYPLYRRRNTGIIYNTSRNHTFDNRFVVPYNSYLILTFICHINVIAASSIYYIYI